MHQNTPFRVNFFLWEGVQRVTVYFSKPLPQCGPPEVAWYIV